MDLVKSATFKSGGCYMFSNLRGCDGGRLYFNGGSCVTLNGQILNRGKQFALDDVEVVVATFDLEDIRFVTFADNCFLDPFGVERCTDRETCPQELQEQHQVSFARRCQVAELPARQGGFRPDFREFDLDVAGPTGGR